MRHRELFRWNESETDTLGSHSCIWSFEVFTQQPSAGSQDELNWLSEMPWLWRSHFKLLCAALWNLCINHATLSTAPTWFGGSLIFTPGLQRVWDLMQKHKSQPSWCILIANLLYSTIIWLVKALTCDKCIMAQVLPGHVNLLMLNYVV